MAASASSSSATTTPPPATKYLPLSYNPDNSRSSATHLILTLFPDWAAKDLEFQRFTDGITNTLLKCTNTSLPQNQRDANAVLLRAYGRETGILIDRERECTSHALLATHHLAPPLLARFTNGLLYRFVPGRVCLPADLSSPPIARAIARRLGEWHRVLPVGRLSDTQTPPLHDDGSSTEDALLAAVGGARPVRYENSLWGVLGKWITAVPDSTQREELARELAWLEGESGLKGMDGGVGGVFGHCDLLSGNVIVLPSSSAGTPTDGSGDGSGDDIDPPTPSSPGQQDTKTRVAFIDYEYATPCERAFDLSNHFSEYGGFECDYTLLPTPSQRRAFLSAYLASYHQRPPTDQELTALMAEVDAFRGLPGFYWGVWALVQAGISQIDFDYAGYAVTRLGEYWAWKRGTGGVREGRWGGRE